jgi:hypothetical protein
MTSGVIAMGVIVSLLYLGSLLWARYVEPPYEAEEEALPPDDPLRPDDAPPPDTFECRSAVHEAGHLVAVWACTHTQGISVSIEEDDAEVDDEVVPDDV